ncbi:MAG TPA: ATP synthase F1 subunit delta [Deltaproteobacteria bacterium]|nr:ATP synthase F1 subunit delta [Deltaproteobacteria bacterium]
MIDNTISKRYAKALVQLGSECGQVEVFRKELAEMGGMLACSDELRVLFANPAFTVEQKKQVMKDLLTKTSCTGYIANLMLLLVEKGRVSLLSQIVQSYADLADSLSGVITPCIKTAFPLDDSQVASISAALEKRTGKKVVPQVIQEPDLLAGMVVQIGDIVYDTSVKTQLNRIQDILQKG